MLLEEVGNFLCFSIAINGLVIGAVDVELDEVAAVV